MAEKQLADLIKYQLRHQGSYTYGDLEAELDREELKLNIRLAPEQRLA